MNHPYRLPERHPFVGPIEQMAETNTYFRRVVYTAGHMQLVLMSLRPGEEIGREVHKHVDQFFRIEKGSAIFVLGDHDEQRLKSGGAVIVPAGTYHNVINPSRTQALKLYTIYTPPQHAPGTVHRTKADAIAAEHHRTQWSERRRR